MTRARLARLGVLSRKIDGAYGAWENHGNHGKKRLSEEEIEAILSAPRRPVEEMSDDELVREWEAMRASPVHRASILELEAMSEAELLAELAEIQRLRGEA